MGLVFVDTGIAVLAGGLAEAGFQGVASFCAGSCYDGYRHGFHNLAPAFPFRELQQIICAHQEHKSFMRPAFFGAAQCLYRIACAKFLFHMVDMHAGRQVQGSDTCDALGIRGMIYF